VHPFLEIADAFAHPTHNFGDATAAKENYDDGDDDQPVNWTEFTHLQLPQLSRPKVSLAAQAFYLKEP
jgi:hypothetical protein